MQIWKLRSLIFAKRPNVFPLKVPENYKKYIGCSKKLHCVKIIKKQFCKSILSHSKCFFSDNGCKFGTHAGKRSAIAEFFQLEIHKWRKKDFFSENVLFFQLLNKSLRHVECTFNCHAKKIPQKGWSFSAKCLTMKRMFLETNPFPQVVDFGHQKCTFEKFAKKRYTKPGRLQLKVGSWWKKNNFLKQNLFFPFDM